MAKPKIEAVSVRSGIAPTVWVKLLGAVTLVAVTVLCEVPPVQRTVGPA